MYFISCEVFIKCLVVDCIVICEFVILIGFFSYIIIFFYKNNSNVYYVVIYLYKFYL